MCVSLCMHMAAIVDSALLITLLATCVHSYVFKHLHTPVYFEVLASFHNLVTDNINLYCYHTTKVI